MAGPPKFGGARSLNPRSTKGVSGLDAHSGKANATGPNEMTHNETGSDTRETPK